MDTIEIERVHAKLADHQLKATAQRVLIYNTILSCENHPSVEQIYNLINPGHPSISLATVYNTLETFAQQGLINKVLTKRGQMRYDPILESHGHIYCANTQEIVDYFDEELNELITSFFKKKKFTNLKIKNISLNINGDKIDPEKEVTIK